MSSFVNATIYGRLGQDPTIRNPGTEQAVCHFSVATDRRVKKDGDWKNETQWWNITTFGKQAESCAQYLSKGSEVIVRTTEIFVRDYEKGGEKRFSLEAIAPPFGVTFVGSKKDGAAKSESAKAGSNAPPDDQIPF